MTISLTVLVATSLLLGLLSFLVSVVAFAVSVASSPSRQPERATDGNLDRYYWVSALVIKNLSAVPESERDGAAPMTTINTSLPVMSVGGPMNMFNLCQVMYMMHETSHISIIAITEIEKCQDL